MKEISLLLEDDEIMILRSGVRMLQIIIPEAQNNETVKSYTEKVLEATNSISQEYRKEIGKMQRAMRRLQGSLVHTEFMSAFANFERAIVEESNKEK